jgi:transcriptional regulator with XRE-family HTH domain
MIHHDLRATRIRLGLSQTAVGRELGVTLRTIQRWESGEMGIHKLRVRTVRAWIRKNREIEK